MFCQPTPELGPDKQQHSAGDRTRNNLSWNSSGYEFFYHLDEMSLARAPILAWAARGGSAPEPTSVAADAVVRAGGYIDYAAAMLERVTGGLAVGRVVPSLRR
jgi:hypothetical protein